MQSWSAEEVVLLHPHPKMLVPALHHALKFGARLVVVLHCWRNLCSTYLLMRGGHLPAIAVDAIVCRPNFLGGEKAPAFRGVRNFDTVIFDITLNPNLPLEEQLTPSTGLESCILQGCWYCSV